MKDQDQIKAIAELDGWKQTEQDRQSLIAWSEVYGEHYIDDEEYHGVPPYLSSRDAIVPVIEKQGHETKIDVINKLAEMLGIDSDWSEQGASLAILEASPSQLCEALLRATGKWVTDT